MDREYRPLLDEWPTISFKEIEVIDEGSISGMLFQSFLTILCLPETMASSVIELFKEA